MKYDFTTIYQRQGRDALALDCIPAQPREGFDPIPMWVADMNFATAPAVLDSIRSRLEHPIFGYFNPRDEYVDAILRWQSRRNDVSLTPSQIGYENGVLGGVVNALNALRPRGKKALLHSPTYTGFTSALSSAGYEIVLSPLKPDENGVWRMDLEDMRQKIVENDLSVAVFCSPHNPCGRVWERRELEDAMALFEKYGVEVVSDEIWSDLILPGNRHIPTQSVSDYARDHVVAMYAVTKSFNLAGLVGSYHIARNPELQERLQAQSRKTHYNNMNLLSMYALMGAYSAEGEEWLDELLEVLAVNARYAVRTIQERFDGVRCAQPQGTYMIFPDCREWCERNGKTMDELLRAAWDVGVAVQDGRPFHGEYNMRINLALPLSRLEEAFDRLDRYAFNA